MHDIDVFGKTAKKLDEHLFEIEGLLSEEQIENLSKKEYQIEVIADAEEIAKERLKDVADFKKYINSYECLTLCIKYAYFTLLKISLNRDLLVLYKSYFLF